jgi:hypothetical protein
MASAHEIARRHLQAALEEAAASSVPDDAVARAFLISAVEVFRASRSVEDIRAELEFVTENLEPDDEFFPFMRP